MGLFRVGSLVTLVQFEGRTHLRVNCRVVALNSLQSLKQVTWLALGVGDVKHFSTGADQFPTFAIMGSD